MLIKPLISSLICLCVATQAIANIKGSAVPGGIKKLSIPSQTLPILNYDNHRVAVIKKDQGYLAVIGIPINVQIQPQTLIQTFPPNKSYQFDIKQKAYKVQKLTIKNTRKVTPLLEDEARITEEQLDLNKTLAHWRIVADPFAQSFIAPVRGYITSTFGLSRVYNGIPKAPHTALDIAASQGTPIKATADGQVINIHDRFFTGNTVIIDHGQGVMSLYAHMHEVKVTNGQWLKQGDIIGTVGKTGRVTGPHLHWAIYLNQTSVDPLLLIDSKDVLPIATPKKEHVAITKKTTPQFSKSKNTIRG